MPTYEYRCDEGHTWTNTRSITDPEPAAKCCKPGCHATVSRVYKTAAVIFKGHGWVSTDKLT